MKFSALIYHLDVFLLERIVYNLEVKGDSALFHFRVLALNPMWFRGTKWTVSGNPAYTLIRGEYYLWDIYTTKKKYKPFCEEQPRE